MVIYDGFSQKSPVGKTYFISGNIKRVSSDEAIAGASIQVELMGIGTKASRELKVNGIIEIKSQSNFYTLNEPSQGF